MRAELGKVAFTKGCLTQEQVACGIGRRADLELARRESALKMKKEEY